MVNDATAARLHLEVSGTAFAPWATTTVALQAGLYTLIADATGHSEPVTVEEGQTVLALSTLPEQAEPSTPTPSPVPVTPTATATPVRLPTATAAPQVSSTPTPGPPSTVTPTPAMRPTSSPADQPVAEAAQVLAFTTQDWTGAYPDVVTAVYQRDCVALYGVHSQYPTWSRIGVHSGGEE